MAFAEILKEIIRASSATAKRGSVMSSLQWIIGLVLAATVASGVGKAPAWLTAVLAVSLAGLVILYGTMFVYFAIKNSDALRSETYTLEKIAMEKGLIGDSGRGLFRPLVTIETGALVSGSSNIPKAGELPSGDSGDE